MRQTVPLKVENQPISYPGSSEVRATADVTVLRLQRVLNKQILM